MLIFNVLLPFGFESTGFRIGAKSLLHCWQISLPVPVSGESFHFDFPGQKLGKLDCCTFSAGSKPMQAYAVVIESIILALLLAFTEVVEPLLNERYRV